MLRSKSGNQPDGQASCKAALRPRLRSNCHRCWCRTWPRSGDRALGRGSGPDRRRRAEGCRHGFFWGRGERAIAKPVERACGGCRVRRCQSGRGKMIPAVLGEPVPRIRTRNFDHAGRIYDVSASVLPQSPRTVTVRVTCNGHAIYYDWRRHSLEHRPCR